MPAYTPPSLTAANFALVAYTPPAIDGANFELGGGGVSVTPGGVVAEWVRGTPAVATARLANPASVVVEWVPGTPSVAFSGGLNVTTGGVVAEWLFGAPTVSIGIGITPSAVVAEWLPGTPSAGSGVEITTGGVVAEWLPGVPFVGLAVFPPGVVAEWLPGTPSIATGIMVSPPGGMAHVVVGTEPTIRRYNGRLTGAIYLMIARPNGEPVGVVSTVTEWEMKRELNRVGSWSAKFPADAVMVDGQPLGRLIGRGWRVSALQEGVNPDNRPDREWLMFDAVVETREFVAGEGGAAVCAVSGSLRGIRWADRMLPPVNVWTQAPVAQIVHDLVPDAITPPAANARRLTLTFNAAGDANTSILFRLLRVAELSHFAIRESWDQDRFELVDVDALPQPQYVAMAPGAAAADAGRHGVVLMGDSVKITRDGTELANRIIAYGVDILADGTLGGGPPPEIPLTLQHADLTVPEHPVVNPAPGVYAVQDAVSIATYGLAERVIVRSDLKVPIATSLARRRVANALYTVAVGELRRRRSPRMQIAFSVANGPDVWLLPGDTVRVVYSGNGWEEIDAVAIVRSRVDKATVGGAREVTLTVETPEIPIPTIDLGDGMPTWAIPVWRPTPVPGGGGTPAPVPTTPISGCCSDPTTDVEDNETPPAPVNDSGVVPGRLVVYAGTPTGRRLYFRDSETGVWTESVADTPTGNYTDSGSVAYIGGTTILYRSAQPPGSPFHSRENAGFVWKTTDWGETWAPVNVSDVAPLVNHFTKRPTADGALVLRMRTEPSEDDPETYGWRTDLFSTLDGSAFDLMATFDAAGVAVTQTLQGIAVALTGTATTGAGPAFDVPPRVGVIRGTNVETVVVGPADSLVTRGERSNAALLLYAAAGYRVVSAATVIGGTERYAIISTRKYNGLTDTWEPVNVALTVEGVNWEVVGAVARYTGFEAWVAFTGGVWRTRDGGETWEFMQGSPTNIRGIAYDPRRNILYVWKMGPPRVLAWMEPVRGSRPPVDITGNLRDVMTIGDGPRAGAWSIDVLPTETVLRLPPMAIDGTIWPIDYGFDIGS
jgi:hypothetical protein